MTKAIAGTRHSRAALAASIVAIPCSARADAGVPMLALVWPASWILFIPVVAIEAWIARRITGLSVKRSVLATSLANGVSTLVGIPLVWILLALIQVFMVPRGGEALGLDSFWHRVFAVTAQAPWLIPYESDLHWMVPLAGIVLLVPFFFTSVLVEWMVFKRFCTSAPGVARRWSWVANGVTYCLMLAGLVITLIVDLARAPGA